jgi:hypothetical protein
LAEAASEVSSAETELSPPGSDDAVALRERAEERKRKRQTAAKDDWFASHGKYIAIGFVVALLATIYAARSQRKSAPPDVAKPHAQENESHASPIRTASAEKPAQDKTRPAVAITSVSPTKPSPGESQTALHPPTIPQLATQTEPGAASDGLFPWAKREEERVASRTADAVSPTVSDAAASTAAAVQPAGQPSYPSTPYPGDYRQAAPSQPLYPTTNSPSGYRHERSGSGFH